MRVWGVVFMGLAAALVRTHGSTLGRTRPPQDGERKVFFAARAR